MWFVSETFNGLETCPTYYQLLVKKNREQPGVQIVTDGPEGKALPAPPLERQGQLLYLALRLGSPIFQLGPTKIGGMGMDQEPETYGM
jgi:hypothetical protein